MSPTLWTPGPRQNLAFSFQSPNATTQTPAPHQGLLGGQDPRWAKPKAAAEPIASPSGSRHRSHPTSQPSPQTHKQGSHVTLHMRQSWGSEKSRDLTKAGGWCGRRGQQPGHCQAGGRAESWRAGHQWAASEVPSAALHPLAPCRAAPRSQPPAPSVGAHCPRALSC